MANLGDINHWTRSKFDLFAACEIEVVHLLYPAAFLWVLFALFLVACTKRNIKHSPIILFQPEGAWKPGHFSELWLQVCSW